MKKILVLSSLAFVLTSCSNDTGNKSKVVVSKESSVETTKIAADTTSEKVKEVNISFEEKDFASYVGKYKNVGNGTLGNDFMTVESGGTLRNTILEPSNFKIVERNGKKYYISTTRVVRIPTEYNLVPAGTDPAPGFETSVKSDATKNRIFVKVEDQGEAGVYEQEGVSMTPKEIKKSEFIEAQSEALAKGMKAFGEKMNQVPYEKTDVPNKLTWQSGGDVSGYKIYESYIYKSGGTTHRYFFVTNSSGNPEVLYSTGGTSVKHTANADIVAMFKGIHAGKPSAENSKSESKSSSNSKTYAGIYRAENGDEVVIQEDGTLKFLKDNRTLVSRANSDGSISFAPTNDYYSPANVAMHHLIPANRPMPSYYSQYKDIDDSSKDRIIFSMPGALPEKNVREIYFKVGDNKKETKQENKSSKSKLDIDAIAKGDLSSAAGSHTFDDNKVVITKDSITVGKRETNLSNFAKKDGVAFVRVVPKDRSGLGMSSGENYYYYYYFVPAGMPNPFIAPNADTAKYYLMLILIVIELLL